MCSPAPARRSSSSTTAVTTIPSRSRRRRWRRCPRARCCGSTAIPARAGPYRGCPRRIGKRRRLHGRRPCLRPRGSRFPRRGPRPRRRRGRLAHHPGIADHRRKSTSGVHGSLLQHDGTSRDAAADPRHAVWLQGVPARRRATEIFRSSTINRFAFDVEVLTIAARGSSRSSRSRCCGPRSRGDARGRSVADDR